MCSKSARQQSPLRQPRWSAHTAFRFVIYDVWRRIEILRKAKLHVRKKGFQQNLRLIASTSAEQIREAVQTVGDVSTLRNVMADVASARLCAGLFRKRVHVSCCAGLLLRVTLLFHFPPCPWLLMNSLSFAGSGRLLCRCCRI